jgi:hypothetical protein
MPLIVGGVVLALGILGGACYFALSGNDQGSNTAQLDIAKKPEAPAAPAANVPAKDAPVVAANTPLDRAKKVVTDAQLLEQGRRESDAVNALDAALEQGWPTDAKKLITDAKGAILDRFKTKIADARSLVDNNNLAQARSVLADLKTRCPDNLMPGLIEVESRLNGVVAKQDAQQPPPRETPEPPRQDAPKGETPTPAPKQDTPADIGNAASEKARFALARSQVTKALAEFDVETAKKALEGDATPYQVKEIADQVDLDRKRIEAVEKLAALACEGYKKSIGEVIDLQLRVGQKLEGKLSKVENSKLGIQIGGAPTAPSVMIPLGKVALDPVFTRAESAAKDHPEWFFFGKGVLLACCGQRAKATDVLELASALPAAAQLKKQLLDNDPTLEPPASDAPIATGEKPKEGGEITFNPNDPEDPFGLKKNKKKKPKTWMDDVSGGVEWSAAWEFDTEHYHIKTNVKKEYAQRWAKILEALAKRYLAIFEFADNDFKFKKNEFDLYKSQSEFMAREKMSPNVGGFYEPWSKRLVTFQGPWEGADDATTLSIVAHEATHQFQNLVLRQMEHAPTFMIEGLATFFEGTVIRDDEVIIGRISSMRLKDLQRGIKDNTYIHMNELIHTEHRNYGGFHYAHGWGLMHWAFFGPLSGTDKKAGPSKNLICSFWKLCCTKPTTGDDFEQYVKGLGPGWNIDKLEQAWKDWVMALDIHNDPAIKAYEKRTGKHFPVEDYEETEKKDDKKDEKKNN